MNVIGEAQPKGQLRELQECASNILSHREGRKVHLMPLHSTASTLLLH